METKVLDDKRVSLKQLNVVNVRHLHDIKLMLESEEGKPRHLILTGKNGSGKTSVLKAMSEQLDCYFSTLMPLEVKLGRSLTIEELSTKMDMPPERVNECLSCINMTFNVPMKDVYEAFMKGSLIIAFFQEKRTFETLPVQHIEKVPLKDRYGILEEPRRDFVRYLADKKFTQYLYDVNNDQEKANVIEEWFDSLEVVLREIFEDPSITLSIDVDTFDFSIKSTKREPFGFNTLSAGYAAMLDIVVDIIMRMEKRAKGLFSFNQPGIVLIDEPETHSHYALQKKIMPFLIKLFPNIQFIVATHSAFIINSMDNVVIYDLENQTLVENGLKNVSYDGIIRGYFDVSTYLNEVIEKFERFKELVTKDNRTDEDYGEIGSLQGFLEDIPDYLGREIALSYKKLKLAFYNRKDLK